MSDVWGWSRGVTFELCVQAAVEVEAKAKLGRRKLTMRARRELTNNGDQAGTHAWVEQTVDQINGRYRKRVTLADGEVVKPVEGPLGDQRLNEPTSLFTDGSPVFTLGVRGGTRPIYTWTVSVELALF